MKLSLLLSLAAGGVLIFLFAVILFIKKPRKLKNDRFAASWKELQSYCKDAATWPKAILEADKLLDFALKKRKLKGKTMGARMVAAQRQLTNNDAVWYAHNFAKKLAAGADIKLKESDVKMVLTGFKQALKDIGAFPPTNPEKDSKRS